MRYVGIKGKVWEEVKAWTRRTWTDCYTCGARNIEGKNAQAGHYWPVALNGSNNNRSWDERFIRLQCGYCNGTGQGRQADYRKNLVKELGEKVVAQYEKDARAKKVDRVTDWNAIKNKFENL